MRTVFNNISNTKRIYAIIGLVLIITITFETAQQLFYIKRFNLGSDVTFFGLLKTQTYRWLIWLVLSVPLIWFVKTNATKHTLTLSNYIKYSLVILGLVFINIICISLAQALSAEDTITLSAFITEYVTFFTFQKGPMYTLGYIAITIILHFYFINEQLQIEVQTLADIKQENKDLYQQLSTKIEDKASILNIKIGNKRKIIPVKDIYWIEADDYCVKVHTTSAQSYTMRSSLKALEQKLDHNFLRVHRKAIVNMAFAKEVNLSQSPVLVLENDVEVAVSKSNLKMVRDFVA
jgi:DNA-binding LytR/AlgR family response regulator